MRIMGIDYGERHIGIAMSDELGLTAQGLFTIERRNRRQVLEAVGDLVSRYGVEQIVLGYPVRLDGSKGIQCGKVDRFTALLKARFGLPVVLREETLTTKEAEGLMREAGVPGKRRRRIVDRLAASLILQGHLDALKTLEAIGTAHEQTETP